jgi:hypothetical protein
MNKFGLAIGLATVLFIAGCEQKGTQNLARSLEKNL